jgi:molybdate transport system ATP-binding protein
VIRVSVFLERPGFSLDIAFDEPSRVLGVFGPSGAGKTTLVNLIAGLQRPDRGSIEIAGATLFDSERNIQAPAHRRRVGVVFQEHRLFPHLSVRGNLLYGARSGAELERTAKLLELSSMLERGVRDLSGGERQRVSLGRALLSDPRILVLDEPLASLDVRLRDQIVPYLSRIRDEMSIPMLYVSHDLTEILRLTDRVLFMENGRSVGHGRYSDIVHDDAVLSVVRDRGMENILSAKVIEHREADGVSVLELVPRGGGQPCRLSAPLCRHPAGSPVLISIKPWDVALAREAISGVSIQNQSHGMVQRCTDHEQGVLVQIDMGATQPLIVEISRRAAAALPVSVGTSVVCLIKSHAIRYVQGRT